MSEIGFRFIFRRLVYYTITNTQVLSISQLRLLLGYPRLSAIAADFDHHRDDPNGMVPAYRGERVV